jgi:hypothetical protein
MVDFGGSFERAAEKADRIERKLDSDSPTK